MSSILITFYLYLFLHLFVLIVKHRNISFKRDLSIVESYFAVKGPMTDILITGYLVGVLAGMNYCCEFRADQIILFCVKM